MTPDDRFDLALRAFYWGVVAFAFGTGAFFVVVIWRVAHMH